MEQIKYESKNEVKKELTDEWQRLCSNFKTDFNKNQKSIANASAHSARSNSKLIKFKRSLNLIKYSDDQKRELFARQKGVCVKCESECKLEEMEADHIPKLLETRTNFALVYKSLAFGRQNCARKLSNALQAMQQNKIG